MEITEIRVVPDELVDGFAKLMWTQSYGSGAPTHHVLHLKEGQARSICNDLTTMFRQLDGMKTFPTAGHADQVQENIPYHLQMAALRGQVQALQQQDGDIARRIRELETSVASLPAVEQDVNDVENVASGLDARLSKLEHAVSFADGRGDHQHGAAGPEPELELIARLAAAIGTLRGRG